MNLKEMLAAAIKKFEAAETLEEAETVKKEIDEIKQKMALAEVKQNTLAALGSQNTGGDSVSGNAPAKSLGAHFVKSFNDSSVYKKGQRFDYAAPEYKAAAPHVTPSSIAPALTDVDTNMVLQYRRPLVIADLFGTESIKGTSLTYFVESSTVEGGFAPVAEGAKKPMISFGDPTAVTESLTKIAAYYKESDEIIEDAEWLASSIDNRALYLYDLKEEDQLLNGSGSSGNICGILNRSGIQTATYTDQDDIFKAIMSVKNQSGFSADAVVINPADYQTLRLKKDQNNQYYGGGFFYGEYGASGMVEQAPIWGLRTLVTPAIAQGTVLVGAFHNGASVVRKHGVVVEMTNSNEDDIAYNRVTIRVENRVLLAVRYPMAFVKLTASNPL